MFKRKPKTTVIYTHGLQGTQAWTRDADGKLVSVTDAPRSSAPWWNVSRSQVGEVIGTVVLLVLLGMVLATVGFWWTVAGTIAIALVLFISKL